MSIRTISMTPTTPTTPVASGAANANTLGVTVPTQSQMTNPPAPQLSPIQKLVNALYPEIDYATRPPYYSSTCSLSQTNAVVPAEVCTIDQLSTLGIYDSKEYIKKNDKYLTDLRTYNVDKDNKDNRTKTICKKNLKGDRANLNCLYEHGAGYIRKPGDSDTCMMYDCPPGFERSGNDCKKILLDAKVDKRARCDERWSDWFMIPNYHLGNKYQSQEKGGICYAPCPTYHVPNYATDPVDGAKVDFTSSDKVNKCVARNIYFGGKYSEGSEQCPLAWIHRLTATPDSLNKIYKDKLTASTSNIAYNNLFNVVNTNSKNLMTTMLNDTPLILEDVSLPTPEMEYACSTLNTSERLQYAYTQCKALKDNEETYKENLAKNDTSGAVDQKIIMLKQSCNSLFCPETPDSDSTPFTLINKDMEKHKICFSQIGNVDPSKVTKKLDKNGNEIYPEDDPPPDASSGENLVYTALWMFIYLILVPVGIVLAYYIIVNGGPIALDVLKLSMRFTYYALTWILYIISFTNLDHRPDFFLRMDDINPEYVNKMATKFETEFKLPHGTADYGRMHPSWRLHSRKWTEN